MKTILFFGRWFVPGLTFLLVLSALYSFAPAHATPSHVSEENTNFVQEPITGTVYDIGGPIPGVTVRVKGTALSTITNEVGEYTIKAPPGSTLVFSYPGYENIEIKVQDQFVIDVELSEIIALQEAVINAGYYTVKDKERTGSISKITSKEIENQPVTNVLAAMQGRMSGVQVIQNSGVPGGGFEVMIRGKNSIAAGNAPLYIIDGVPYDTQTMGSLQISGAVIPSSVINPLNFLDPSSIESIEVLKDADATAIYGSRGANGVVLITTKKGMADKTLVTVNFTTGMADPTKLMKLLNSEQYASIRREAFNNDGIETPPPYAYDINGTWDPDRYTDWQKEFIGNTAYFNSAKISISGGNQQTRFLIGGNFSKESTLFPGNYNYKKTSIFSTLNHSSKDEKFKFFFNGQFGLDNNFLPPSDLTFAARTLSPNAPSLYDDYGELNWEESTWTNPLAAMEATYNNNSRNMVTNAGFTYQLWRNTEFKSSFGYSHALLEELKLTPHTIYNPAYGFTSDYSTHFNNLSKRSSWIIEPQVNGNYDLWKGKFSITLGATAQQQSFNNLSVLGEGFANNAFIENISAAKRLFIQGEMSSAYHYLAFFTRVNYNLNQKYILNLTGRRDGSSRFGADNRFANFGAMGAAWIFSREAFLEGIKGWLSFGKIRFSYGTSGNDQIGDHQYLNTFTFSDPIYDGNIGLQPTRLYNPAFAWEKNRKLDLALEMGFLSDRLFMEAGYYNNRSDNQLIGNPLPGTTGFPNIQANLNATVENSGWEFSLKSENFRSVDFKWSTSLNLTVPQNKLIAFDGLEKSAYANQLVIGAPITVAKLYKLNGVDPQTGLYVFEDFNGDGKITASEDREYLADLEPEFYGGISNSIRYKNWNLDFLFQFVKKIGYNEFYGIYNPPGTMYNLPAGILDHWQQPGDQTRFQRMTSGADSEAYLAHNRFSTSSGVISDTSFIRLKSLSISYQIPLKGDGDQACRVFMDAFNLWTITKFKGGDPEQLNNYLPPLRRVSIGFELTF